MKFKAKRIDNGKWVHGWLLGNPKSDKGVFIVTYYMYANRKDKNVIPYKSLEYYEVDPKTICKCTNFKDSLGVEIYEWDKLSDDSCENMIVRFGEFLLTKDDFGIEYRPVGFYVQFNDNSGDYPINDNPSIQYSIRSGKTRVIGNVHDDGDKNTHDNIDNIVHCLTCGSDDLAMLYSHPDASEYKCINCGDKFVG